MNPYQTIVNTLTANSVDCLELLHEPIYSSVEASKVRGIILEECAKSLLLKAKDEFVLVVLSGTETLDSKKFKKVHGIRDLRFASPAEVRTRMGCIVGACYPFGSVIGLKTYLNATMLRQNRISFNPGLHNKTIKIKLKDYLKIENPIIVDISSC